MPIVQYVLPRADLDMVISVALIGTEPLSSRAFLDTTMREQPEHTLTADICNRIAFEVFIHY
jgi:hypothetical protein